MEKLTVHHIYSIREALDQILDDDGLEFSDFSAKELAELVGERVNAHAEIIAKNDLTLRNNEKACGYVGEI